MIVTILIITLTLLVFKVYSVIVINPISQIIIFNFNLFVDKI